MGRTFAKAVRLAPSNLTYHKLLGRAPKTPKWRDQAESIYGASSTPTPTTPECYLELAEIHEEGGMPSQARKMYEKIICLDPSHETALAKLGDDAPKKSSFLPKSRSGSEPTSH